MIDHKIKINKALPGDETGIARVHKETWLATYPNTGAGISREDILLLTADFDSDNATTEWRKKIMQNGSDRYICVAKDADKIVAFCCGKNFADYNQLSALYILPGYHRQGIGKRLVKEIFNWLGKDKKIVVTPVSYNEKAIAFYQKMGFVKTGKTGLGKKLPNNKIIPMTEMTLDPKNYGK